MCEHVSYVDRKSFQRFGGMEYPTLAGGLGGLPRRDFSISGMCSKLFLGSHFVLFINYYYYFKSSRYG